MGSVYKSVHAHKPSKNHPWRKTPTPKVAKWAEEESKITGVNNFLKGGGRSWNSDTK